MICMLFYIENYINISRLVINMDLRREITIAVQLDKFKNIELFKQGMYQIRLRVSYELNGLLHFAEPGTIWSNSEKSNKKSSGNIRPAHILDEFSCFNSRIMLVRYQEETLSLLESCIFTCQIPYTSPVFPIKVHADLYFTNLEKKTPATLTFRALNTNPIFSCVASKEYLITNAFKSMSHYLPISFDPKYFCSLESIVHVYTNRICDTYDKILNVLFGNKTIAGGSAIEKSYCRVIDPLFLSYSSIRNFFIDFSDILCVSPKEIPKKISLPLIGNDNEKLSFNEVINTHDTKKVVNAIFEESQNLAEIIENSIQALLHLTIYNSGKVITVLKNKFHIEVWQHFQEFIKVEEVTSEFSTHYSSQNMMMSKAFQIRDCDYMNNLENLPIQAEDLYNVPICHPIFFMDSEAKHSQYILDSSILKGPEIHIIFLAHGYKGSSVDMHMIKGYINMIYPAVHVYSCKCNENLTDCNIELLGENLAEEVIHYLYEIKVPKHRLKISFLGHSMGGLVLRAALPSLSDYKSCMGSFITLSSPHIGIVYANNTLLQIGKWIIKKLQKSVSFTQMTMKDHKNPRESFIYKLSNSEGLNWFKHVIFFSCTDDPYVPVDSAGIYVAPGAKGTKNEQVIEEIVSNILKKISYERLVKVDVNFKHKELLDSCVCCGNRHIDFLDDPCFIKMLCYSMPRLFL